MPKAAATKLSSKTVQDIIKQQAQARALFDSIGDGAISTDEAGHVQRINQAALDLLGYNETDLIGEWFPRVLLAQSEKGEFVNPLDRPITKAMLTGKAINEKMIYLTKDKRRLPVSITVAPVVVDGKPVGAIEVFRDITHEQEVDRMKSEFISIASHQLRTPLTAIKTYAHLLSSGFKGKLSDDQLEFMHIILGSIDRMNELINILLDISRIEEGKISIVLKETNIQKLIEGVLHEQNPRAAEKEISLKFEKPDEPIVAIVDRVLTSEIVANLVSNAIKYTPQKGTITVSIKDKGKELLLSVSDNGYGIPRIEQPRVFSKFFRADNIKRREPSGTGLGLYMVKQIVENMGGRIWFLSRENAGTTFSVSIPKEMRE